MKRTLVSSSPIVLCLIHCPAFAHIGARQSLLNTDVKKEIDHLAAFLRLAVEHKQAIGFGGQLLIEPKPKEPTAHQLRSFSECGGFFLASSVPCAFSYRSCPTELILGRKRYQTRFMCSYLLLCFFSPLHPFALLRLSDTTMTRRPCGAF